MKNIYSTVFQLRTYLVKKETLDMKAHLQNLFNTYNSSDPGFYKKNPTPSLQKIRAVLDKWDGQTDLDSSLQAASVDLQTNDLLAVLITYARLMIIEARNTVKEIENNVSVINPPY